MNFWKKYFKNTLANEQRPEAGSACPMFDLTEPISNGVVLEF